VPIDDELLTAFLDQELPPVERQKVAALVQSDAGWEKRLEDFRKTSNAIKKLSTPTLTELERDKLFERIVSYKAEGAERRRVPRFRRRWILLAAIIVPTFFTLAFFQNPNSTIRIYLKRDGLTLQAGRSILEDDLAGSKRWTSPKLWGTFDPEKKSELMFQVDAKKIENTHVIAVVEYDFDGDGQVERTEKYEPAELDARIGWERFTPRKVEEEGEFADFKGGLIALTLSQPAGEPEAVRLSGTPGELILPYTSIRSGKGAYE